MSKPDSIKKTTREKIFDVVLKTFEELVGHQASDKVKRRIEKKSKKLSSSIVILLKKDARKAEKLNKGNEPKSDKAPKAGKTKKNKAKKELVIANQN